MVTETLLRTPFSVIGQCSLVPSSHWLQGTFARINISQAAFGIVFQNHRRLPVNIFCVKITAVGSLSGLLGGFSKLVSDFKGAR
jgi:hypothetical protein